MSDKGFNVQIGIDPETGFPFGGNDSNCGTWMDKMGSSEPAGNRGKPATPRDGSAVELVGLAYSVLSWLAGQHRAARYPYPGVVRRHRDGSLTSWTFAQWAERIKHNFERYFWIPVAPSAADLRPDLVHRRGIYKDSHGASRPWADYQLRCNFPIAMVVAPELFDPKHAWLALDAVEKLLLGPLGVKTLDPADWAYRGDYDNSNNSDDPSVAHGFNYHQGPEWVWPLGFYLRARLAFAQQAGRHARTLASCYAALAPLLAELRTSPWRGLPELTNAGGAVCHHSSGRARAPVARRLTSASPAPRPRPVRHALRARAAPAAGRAAPPAAPREGGAVVLQRAAAAPGTAGYRGVQRPLLPLRPAAAGAAGARAPARGRPAGRRRHGRARPPHPRPRHAAAQRRAAPRAARPAAAGAAPGPAPAAPRAARLPAAPAAAVRHAALSGAAPEWAGPAALCRRALDYRQGAAGLWPRVGGAPGSRPPAPLPEAEPDRCTRPQFALDEAEGAEAGPEAGRSRAYSLYERLSKASARLSANLAPATPEGDKASSMALARKVLNTERYNNGARAVRRGSRGSRGSAPGAGWGGARGSRGARQLRATIRAMLAFSSLFYALSFLAFYFLSLP
ncbi:hypothetical protein HF086_016264 [Spodoptera exigua]|uniref:Glycogen debranching enzyme C-terminal domain-containing protein n=1 Tax=Spodoptera exigua TaxID=7107 RepID=A0A922MWV4_SPOEX|nr:hypothetical protein HF086_016264 [Spodoptera exigua]